MSHHVVLVQGGGIGTDQAVAAQRVVTALGVAIDWQEVPAGLAAQEKNLPPLPNELFDQVRAAGVALK
ncbi:MAG: isocitrate dehydrogenase, partial [Gemmataceae bacterium]|nr:isocitrate dehydrogenase [Gemmataceae bacterium]